MNPSSRAAFLLAIFVPCVAAAADAPFAWPDGRRAAVSVSFDDARPTQLTAGAPVLRRYHVHATFYVLPEEVAKSPDGWKRLVAEGHEVGNHTLTHPCTGNFPWSAGKGVEAFTLDRMRQEAVEANKQIEALLGVTPTTFAYPCGETTLGRGRDAVSDVPLMAELFTSARGWATDTTNRPAYVDLSQIRTVSMDGRRFEDLKPFVDKAIVSGTWLVLGGHDVGKRGIETTDQAALRKLLAYITAPERNLWIAPVGSVAPYISAHRADVR